MADSSFIARPAFDWRAVHQSPSYQPLTAGEVEDFELDAEIRRYLDATRQALDIPPERFRVLDWGCGNGRSVARLRADGYEARGVDIEPQRIEQAESYFRERGEDPDAILGVVDPQTNRTGLRSGSIHYLFSSQVLEHVADLDAAAGEMARLLAPGGVAFHRYPADWRIVEPHLDVPLLQWMPGRACRLAWLRVMMGLGLCTRWPTLAEAPPRQERAIYEAFFDEWMHYHPPRKVAAAFRTRGLRTRIVTGEHPRVQGLVPLRNLPLFREAPRLLGWVLSRLLSVELWCCKPAGQEDAGPSG
jgi:SAM-dependent methyltransferase